MEMEEASAPSLDSCKLAKKKSVGRCPPFKRSGAIIPRKIRKAEREKLKRDNMNVLFLELRNAFDSATHNNGKSCTLTDAIRSLQDLVAQVDRLKKENTTLLSESQYVTIEKNELKEENSVLEAQIKKLQIQIDERVHSQSQWSSDPSEFQSNCGTVQSLGDHLVLPVIDNSTQAAPLLGPVLVVPLHNDPKLYTKPAVAEDVTKLPPSVSRPHARYPSPSTWPSNFLSEQPKAN